jgi:uncharacterized protein (TIGR00730 family)
MRICVYGAASPTIDKMYMDQTEKIGETLANRGHNLVFGGGGNGLMGAAARGFKKGNAHIIGVIPKFFDDEKVEAICGFCDQLIMPETMRERKQIMEDNADAFLIVPGGFGTYEEFFEILTLKQLCRHSKPIAVYNIDGFYNEMAEAIDLAMDKNFINKSCKQLYCVANTEEEIIKYLETPVTLPKDIHELKNG